MSATNPALLLSRGARGQELATRLQQMGVRAFLAEDFAEAERILGESNVPVTAALMDVDWIDGELKSAIKRLRRCGPSSGLTFLAFGPAPERAERKILRSAGVNLALWEPFDDGVLRFQVNRAITGDRDDHGREHTRVPTLMVARVQGGGRSKDAIVYSLSAGGAFLETPRASMDGAQVQVDLRLPGQTLTVPARVVFSNVPGNLQRPNLPLGMGVRFDELDRDQSKRIAEFVEERLRQLEV